MQKVPNSASLGAATVLFLLGLLGHQGPLAAADPEFPSSWRTGEIVVDGSADEWAGKLIPLPGFPVDLGIQNDASFLYFCVKTSDEAQKKRLQELGVNFWMDASGKVDRAFGVRYPAGPQKPPSGQGAAPPRGDAPPDGEAPPQEGRPGRGKRQGTQDALQVMGRDAEGGGRMTVASARPIAAAMAERDGVLVLELKVPLAFSIDTPFAILTAPGKTIALAVEGAQPDRELHAGGGRGGRGGEGSDGVSIGRGGVNVGGVSVGRGGIGASTGGGRGGGGGGSRSGGGERSGGPPAEKSSARPFKGSFRVLLSAPPAAPGSTTSPAPASQVSSAPRP